ncbi:MAG: UDP-N-acetylglucosamine 2-epimerase [Paracoccaceae bacterium]
MTTKRIGVFTGSRSEYGLLVPVMRAIAYRDGLEMLVISGDPTPGTPEFPIAAHVPITRADETPGSTPRAIGQGVLGLTEAFDDLALDALVIYGDRFEAFAAMIAATQRGLATAHIEGGDLTQGGTLDDVVRHAMSKLAHLHFPTNAAAADRLRAMGEEDWRITTAGFPPIDLIEAGDYASPKEVAATLGLDPKAPILLFTQHPISTEPQAATADIARCMEALDGFADTAQIILTHPNGDVGSAAIVAALDRFKVRHPSTILYPTLGRRLYHGVLNMIGRGQGACLGNSSSGLKETPAFHCPAIDIGPRQNGRLRGANVLHVDSDASAIRDAIRTALTDKSFRAEVRAAPNPYGQGNAGATIAQVLADADLHAPRLIQKQTLL